MHAKRVPCNHPDQSANINLNLHPPPPGGRGGSAELSVIRQVLRCSSPSPMYDPRRALE